MLLPSSLVGRLLRVQGTGGRPGLGRGGGLLGSGAQDMGPQAPHLLASTLQGRSISADVWLGCWRQPQSIPSARVGAPYHGGCEVRSVPEQPARYPG